MVVAEIVEATFTSADRVRDVIHDFNTDGSEALYPSTRAADREPSAFRNVGRSRRSSSPGRPSTACRFRPGVWPSWPTSCPLCQSRSSQVYWMIH
ncbi:hypothetical protein OG819_34730 [Streptomyces sp. NBC_01549]|nr:hypothetical protein [Streptomyces sp. NBC_01549]